VEWHAHLADLDFVIPNGESYSQFIDRTTTALQELHRKHQGQTVCVVTHGGVIDCLRNYLVSEDDGFGRQARCGNASISELHVNELGEWRITKWNDCSHLAALHKPILVADDVTTTHRRSSKGSDGSETGSS
jgi:probable phosphoglycerate mutase